LQALAQRLADAYVAQVQPAAVQLVGSAASGDADEYSDLDMLVYYDEVPAKEIEPTGDFLFNDIAANGRLKPLHALLRSVSESGGFRL
jgi:hypothetical protein